MYQIVVYVLSHTSIWKRIDTSYSYETIIITVTTLPAPLPFWMLPSVLKMWWVTMTTHCRSYWVPVYYRVTQVQCHRWTYRWVNR